MTAEALGSTRTSSECSSHSSSPPPSSRGSRDDEGERQSDGTYEGSCGGRHSEVVQRRETGEVVRRMVPLPQHSRQTAAAVNGDTHENSEGTCPRFEFCGGIPGVLDIVVNEFRHHDYSSASGPIKPGGCRLNVLYPADEPETAVQGCTFSFWHHIQSCVHVQCISMYIHACILTSIFPHFELWSTWV